MARTYGPHFARIWQEALTLPFQGDLLRSLAFELSSYQKTSVEETLMTMKQTWEDRWAILRTQFPDSLSGSEVEHYYRVSEHGLPISLYWHSLEPDRYALHSVAGLQVVQEFAEGTKVFEFGHGIGSTGILFAEAGFDVTMGDISEAYRAFAEHRFVLRGLNATFLDLNQAQPEPCSFDAIVSFDVLEHLTNPLGAIRNMHEWLKPGGLLVLNVAFGKDPNNPEHIVHRRRGVLDRIRQFGFDSIPNPTLLVFWKRELNSLERRLFRVHDWGVSLSADLVAAAPRLGRLLRSSNLPPMA